MSYKKTNKKSKGKIISWIIMSTLALLILIPCGIHTVKYNYSLAKMLPVSETTKTRAFWFSVNPKKLNKIQQINNDYSYTFNADGKEVTIFDDGHRISIYFNTESGKNELPRIDVYKASEKSVEILKTFCTDGITMYSVNDNSELNETQIDELSKEILKRYNQFIDDYNNV